jgi:hypothetical protein
VERRQGPRYPSAPRVACAVLPTLGNGVWRADVQNVSAGGVRLRVVQPGCPLRPERVLELKLTSPALGTPLAVRLRLTHAAEAAGGDYKVGGAFDRPLTPQQLEAFASAPRPGSSPGSAG